MNATSRLRAALLFPAVIGLVLCCWELYQLLAAGDVENLLRTGLLMAGAVACLLVALDAGRQRRQMLERPTRDGG